MGTIATPQQKLMATNFGNGSETTETKKPSCGGLFLKTTFGNRFS
jgi:hypothetical protein